MAAKNLKSVVMAILAIPLGILTFMAVVATMTYFYSGRVTLDGWVFHVVPTAILVGLFSLLLWKRPKTMAPAENEETKADSAMQGR